MVIFTSRRAHDGGPDSLVAPQPATVPVAVAYVLYFDSEIWFHGKESRYCGENRWEVTSILDCDDLPFISGKHMGEMYSLIGAGRSNRTSEISWPKIGHDPNGGVRTHETFDDHSFSVTAHLSWPPRVTRNIDFIQLDAMEKIYGINSTILKIGNFLSLIWILTHLCNELPSVRNDRLSMWRRNEIDQSMPIVLSTDIHSVWLCILCEWTKNTRNIIEMCLIDLFLVLTQQYVVGNFWDLLVHILESREFLVISELNWSHFSSKKLNKWSNWSCFDRVNFFLNEETNA